jgi:hypothetical protein
MKKESLKKGEFYIMNPDIQKYGCIIFDKFDSKVNRFIFYCAIKNQFPSNGTVMLSLSDLSNLKKYKKSKDKGKAIKNVVPLFGIPVGSDWSVKDNSYIYTGSIQVYIAKNQETSKYFNQ